MVTTPRPSITKAMEDSKKNLDISGFYEPIPLVQHNANLAVVVIELLIGGVRVNVHHTPFCLLFGVVYMLAWHQTYRFMRTRTLMYHFMTWRNGNAFSAKVFLALIFVLVLSSFAAVGVDALRSQPPWGGPLTILLACGLMRVRRPAQAKLREE